LPLITVMSCPINKNALVSEIRQALINEKQNACPIAVRLAWHAAGTFECKGNTGGSNGATMRFAPESTDCANAGLSIMRNILDPIKAKHDNLSFADLWTFSGASAVEFVGGPKIAHEFGRVDHPNGSYCPPNGRLPDASQGAQHLRDVFYRMGFNDQEIVCLSGAHTLGRCHLSRSGFDGPWTRHPLRWDNQYFKNLLDLEWTPRKWDGNLQYQDPTGELMMLPTDLALIQDPEFKKHVEIYAKDQKIFDNDFALAFSKLISLGCPAEKVVVLTEKQIHGENFREAAMHGSHSVVVKLADSCDVHELESTSNRSALHKSAFWNHSKTIEFLLNHCKLDANVQDKAGDTALHDACKFGHVNSVQLLIPVTNLSIKNKNGQTPLQVAQSFNHPEVIQLLTSAESKL